MPNFILRIATIEEIPAMNELIKNSAQSLSQGYYTPDEIDALNKYVFSVDTALVSDQTYFVIENDGTIAACGGFSKRKKLFGGDQYEQTDEFLNPQKDPAKIRAFFVHPNYARQGLATKMLTHCEQKARDAGFISLELMATLPGVPFYQTQGFIKGEEHQLKLENGIEVKLLQMSKEILDLQYIKSNTETSKWDEIKNNRKDLAKDQTLDSGLIFNSCVKN